MYKINSFIIFCILANSYIYASSSLKEELANKTYCITGYTANLRSEPDQKSSIITEMYKFTPIEIIENNEQWSLVRTESFEGWIFNELISNDHSCVIALKSIKTFEDANSKKPFIHRKQVSTKEGFKILKTEIGMTQVEDRAGNIFWLENQNLWPKDKLREISFSL